MNELANTSRSVMGDNRLSRQNSFTALHGSAATEISGLPRSELSYGSRARVAVDSAEFDPARILAQLLNLLLADEYKVYAITRDYHWNVTGPDYYTLRLLFQLQHEKAATWVDFVAEQLREMRLESRVGWEDLKNSARIFAPNGFGLPADLMLQELLRVHEAMIIQLRSDRETCAALFAEESIVDLVGDLREQHENAAWMLRSQLETTSIRSTA